MPASRLLGWPAWSGRSEGSRRRRAIAEFLGAADARAVGRPVDGDRIKQFMDRVEGLRDRWR